MTDLHTIKWLLVGILVAITIIAIASLATVVLFLLIYNTAKEQNQGKVFHATAEDYLAKGEFYELLHCVEEHLNSYPQDAWAHWYKGQVKYHKGMYPESMISFKRVLELKPGWHTSVSSWIELVAAKIQEGPQLVD